jgi:CRP/FNR family cyclic AMP-dependent transcriptional regulator
MGNATSITPSTVLVIDRNEMAKVLHEQHELSDLFINFVLTRNMRIEEGLDRPALQLDREETRARSSIACAIRQARTPSEIAPKSISGDAGGNGRHDAPAGQFFHE